MADILFFTELIPLLSIEVCISYFCDAKLFKILRTKPFSWKPITALDCFCEYPGIFSLHFSNSSCHLCQTDTQQMQKTTCLVFSIFSVWKNIKTRQRT